MVSGACASAQTIRSPFVATFMSTVYGIQLDLRGSATVRDGWADEEIPVGAARTYQGRANAWDLAATRGRVAGGPAQVRCC
jgi:hypothetical protein